MDNSLQTAQWNIVPFQKIPIQIDGIDRTSGQRFPNIEGDFIYIEKADYPVLLGFVNAQTLEQASIVAHIGTQLRCPFKEVTLTHPFLTSPSTVPFNLSLIVGHGPCPEFINQYAFPFLGTYASILVSTDTATNTVISVHIPPGTRFLQELDITFSGSTVTSARWALNAYTSGGPAAHSAPQLTANGLTYNTLNATLGPLDVTVPYTGVFRAAVKNIPIPSGAVSLTINIVGTGLGFVAGFGAVKANWS